MFIELLLFVFCLIIFLLLIIAIPFENISLKPITIWKMSKIPGPRGLPLFGLMFQLMNTPPTELDAFYLKHRKKYPRLFGFWVLGVPFVALFEPDDLEVILSSAHHIKKGCDYYAMVPWLQDGLLLSSGEKWRQRRKLLTPAFHFNILEDSLQHLNKNAKKLLLNMLKKEGEPFVVDELIQPCTLDIICETAMGYSLNSQDSTGGNVTYLEAVKRACFLTVNRILTILHQCEWFFCLTKPGKLYFANLKYLHEFTENIIQEKKMEFAKLESPVKSADIAEDINSDKKKVFLDILIQLNDRYGNLFSDKDIREEVDTFMFEGFDTTSAALVHALYLLGRHPDIQEKAYGELNNIFGESDRSATSKDLHEMHYLEMIIKETLRLYPSVPILSRELTQDAILKDNLVIPSGANITIIPYVIHRDPKYYPNPDVFDPERFSLENCIKRHPYIYIPFSAGPRNCIGQKFAMMELKVVLSTLIRFAKIQSTNEITDSVISKLIIIRSKVPIQIRITPRL